MKIECFQINYTDLSDLFWEYKRKIENLIENIDNCIEKINMFTENAVFTGKTGDAVKSYLGEAHITILSGIKVTAQKLLDNMAAYKDGYRAIDSSTNFKLDEEAIQEFRKKLASNYEDTDEYTGEIRSALSEVSDISDVGMPDSNGVFDIHEQMDSDLIKLVSNVNSYERENVVRLENSVELLLENLQSCLSKIGLSQGAIESYETGSFITGKDAGTLNTGIKIFGDLHEKNKEAYDEIYETEQKIKDEAEKRKTQGIWRTVGGAVLIATGVACIVLTGGAAIPIVADVAVAVGSGTAVFGAADAIEGTQDIYYGSTGDIDSTAVNGIKDDLFQGNEDAYYLTENAFAFAASAMIPIGQASTAGNLTFKSTATIVAKEGISMGAGAGAQKITTDVTGNDTAGMVAGMVASGVTAKGLNGIEAEANKLAKAPKGIDGVTEGAGNLVEDVGKAGKGLEGAAKGAESAAEDAGKVVESGSKTIDDIIDGLPETTNGKGVARNFESTGDFEQTIRDFDALNPIDVKEIQTKYGSGKVGKLSDGTTVVARPQASVGTSLPAGCSNHHHIHARCSYRRRHEPSKAALSSQENPAIRHNYSVHNFWLNHSYHLRAWRRHDGRHGTDNGACSPESVLSLHPSDSVGHRHKRRGGLVASCRERSRYLLQYSGG